MLTSYVLVIPYIYQPYFDECMATLKLHSGHILPVDNTVDNRGVAGSWNLGIDEVKRRQADWLIIASAAIRFDGGGHDLIEQLGRHMDADIVHFATKDFEPQQFKRGTSPGYAKGVLGWHLTAIKRHVLEEVGYFDPNFYPMCFEDVDYDLRINKRYVGVVWPILPVEAHGKSLNHSVALAGLKGQPDLEIAYFATKWGVHPSALAQLGSYAHPFNDSNNSMAFFPPHLGRTWNG